MVATAEDTRFGTSLPPAIRRRLRLQAAAQGVKQATLLAALLDKALMTEAELGALIANGAGDDEHR